MTSATLSFIDERQFLTVIQPVLPLCECADHAPAKFAAEPLHSVADSAATDPTESAIDALQVAADPTGSGASLTETFCLCLGLNP
jgi:hypothetical protein